MTSAGITDNIPTNVTNRRVAWRFGALRVEAVDEPHRDKRRNGTGERDP